jgi:hypothetical protein
MVCFEMRVTVPTKPIIYLFSLHHGTVLASMQFRLPVLIDEACRANIIGMVGRAAKRVVGR